MSCIFSRVVLVASAVYLLADLGHDEVVTWAATAASVVVVVLWSRWGRWHGRSMCRGIGICTESQPTSGCQPALVGEGAGLSDPDPTVMECEGLGCVDSVNRSERERVRSAEGAL